MSRLRDCVAKQMIDRLRITDLSFTTQDGQWENLRITLEQFLRAVIARVVIDHDLVIPWELGEDAAEAPQQHANRFDLVMYGNRYEQHGMDDG